MPRKPPQAVPGAKRIQLGNEEFLSLPWAARRATVSRTQIHEWTRTPCPYLKRRLLTHRERELHSASNITPQRVFISACDCDAVREAIKPLDDYTEIKAAAALASVNPQTMRIWIKAEKPKHPKHRYGCPYLEGRPMRSKMHPKRTANGGIMPSRWVHNDDLTTIMDRRDCALPPRLATSDGIKVSVTEAVKLCGVSKSTIYRWKDEHCCWLGRKLVCEISLVARLDRRRHAAPVCYFPLAELTTIVGNRRRDFQPSEPMPIKIGNSSDDEETSDGRITLNIGNAIVDASIGSMQTPTESEPRKGVGLVDVAQFVINRGWERNIKNARELAKRWADKEKFRPESIGKSKVYKSRPIFKVSDAIKYLDQFIPLDADERKEIRQYLTGVAKPPRDEVSESVGNRRKV